MKYLEFKISEDVLRAKKVDKEGFIRETNAKMKELIEKAWKSLEPCVHEPGDMPTWLKDSEFVRLDLILKYLNTCKHCKAKIRPEKWVEL